jgi:hypothetical protein
MGTIVLGIDSENAKKSFGWSENKRCRWQDGGQETKATSGSNMYYTEHHDVLCKEQCNHCRRVVTADHCSAGTLLACTNSSSVHRKRQH